MGNSKTIEVIKGEEFKIKEITIQENNFFYGVFEQARDRLIDILKANTSNNSEMYCCNRNVCDNFRNKDDDKNNAFKERKYINNIIAFCGERGQGKTSAMLSFTQALKNKNKCKLFRDNNSIINAYTFDILKPIDPTTLESNDNIISNILAVMFNMFKDKWQNSDHSKVCIEQKNDVLKFFNKCYKQINRIKNSNSCKNDTFEDNLENLSERGESSNLSENLEQLIKLVLGFNDGNDKHMLVIQVDDTDLNINRAYEIVEDIRKYLLISNVVVIMAVRIRQLSFAVEQQYRKDLAVMIGSGERIDKYELQQMAERYIEKLIPNGRKISLPEINTSGICNSVDVKLTYKDTDGKVIISHSDNNDLQDQVLKYIFDKTGIMLIHENGKTHPFMPKTMRELVGLLAVLSKLDDLKSDDWDCEKRRHNLDVFQEYLVNTWMVNNVNQGYINFINDIKDVYDQSCHRIIITDICDIVEVQKNNEEKKVIDIYSMNKPDDALINLKKIINETNYKHKSDEDYSLGDVMDAITILEELYPIKSILNFTAALKIIYTIKMFKIAIFDEINNCYNSHINSDYSKQWYQCNLSDINDSDVSYKDVFFLDTFIGGEYYGRYNIYRMIPKSKLLCNINKDVLMSNNPINIEKNGGKELVEINEVCNKLYTSNLFRPTYKSNIFDPYWVRNLELCNKDFSAINIWISNYIVKDINLKEDFDSLIIYLNVDIIRSIISSQITNPNPNHGPQGIGNYILYYFSKVSYCVQDLSYLNENLALSQSAKNIREVTANKDNFELINKLELVINEINQKKKRSLELTIKTTWLNNMYTDSKKFYERAISLIDKVNGLLKKGVISSINESSIESLSDMANEIKGLSVMDNDLRNNAVAVSKKIIDNVNKQIENYNNRPSDISLLDSSDED